MKTRAELKQQAKDQLKENWGNAIGICLLMGLISFGISLIGEFLPPLAIITPILLFPLTIGLIMYFISLARNNSAELSMLFDGYKKCTLNSIVLFILMGIFTLLWTLLFIIPGIIKALSYSMAPYVLADNPTVSPQDAINESKRIMDGHKAELFVLELSFIGWAILAIIPLGLGYIWLTPYVQATYTNFYLALKDKDLSPDTTTTTTADVF